MSPGTFEQPKAVWSCSACGAIYHKDFPRCPTDGAEVVMSERDPLLGSRVGPYTIDQLIAEGGMGRVYLAHHTGQPRRRYALKVLLGDHAASLAMRARFTREAERASQLHHPNLVKVVDFGQSRHGLLYIAMDYVEGPSLATLIGNTPMEPARVIALTRAICKGLAYAHGAGIVHRDLKPENILVSPGPHGEVPRIVDFGLAMSLDQTDARLTETGMTMGTPAFAAPEQISGKPIDHRADLYALGVSMFEMLTGGLAPFEGHIMEVVSARTARDTPRISERAPALAIPPELDDIVARLTRRKPSDRFQSAREVIDALDQIGRLGRLGQPQRIRRGPQARVTTAPLGERAVPRRRRLVAGMLAACGLAVAAWYVAAGAAPAAQLAAPRVSAPAVVVAAAVAAPVAAPAIVREPVRALRSAAPAAAKRRPARGLRARIDSVEVAGSLPPGDVQRAVERWRPAIERCTPVAPQTVVARFSIGETRRARSVRAAGPTATTNACLVTAFTDVPIETAPDAGDVEVTVRIAFVAKT
jgi:eukaryotic-like serine/threonine-protein kinase